MHRINEQQIRKFLRQFANGAADILQRFTQIFAAMRRYEHNAAAVHILIAQLLIFVLIILANRCFKCIDDSIPRHKYVLYNCFAFQIAAIVFRRRKVQFCNTTRKASVHLFGERRILIKRTQTRFHMPYWNLLIKRSQSSHKRSCCIAVHQNNIRLNLLKNLFQLHQNIRSDGGQRLTRPHDVQIIVNFCIKNVNHLLQHLTMLACQANDAFNIRICLQFFYQRAHFDCLRPCTKNTHNLH